MFLCSLFWSLLWQNTHPIPTPVHPSPQLPWLCLLYLHSNYFECLLPQPDWVLQQRDIWGHHLALFPVSDSRHNAAHGLCFIHVCSVTQWWPGVLYKDVWSDKGFAVYLGNGCHEISRLKIKMRIDLDGGRRLWSLTGAEWEVGVRGKGFHSGHTGPFKVTLQCSCVLDAILCQM